MNNSDEYKLSECSILCSLPKNPPLIDINLNIPNIYDEIHPTSNLKFKPLPSTPGHCSKLKLNLKVDSPMFIGGQQIRGVFELISLSDSALQIGEIALHFSAYEEIAWKNFHQSSALYSSRIILQGVNLPPSEAVRGAPTKEGYYVANKKKNVFPFSFQLPTNAPSTYAFNGSEAKLRYLVTGSVEFKFGTLKDVAFISKDVKVLEQWNLLEEKKKSLPVKSSNRRKFFLGGDRVISMSATLIEDFLIAGSSINVAVKVNNGSKKKIQGFKISFVKRLLMLNSALDLMDDTNLKVTDVIHHSVLFRDEVFEPLQENLSTVSIIVPFDSVTIRCTNLAEVRWSIVVSLYMPGLMSKELPVELPVKICHPNSIMISNENINDDAAKNTSASIDIPIPPQRKTLSKKRTVIRSSSTPSNSNAIENSENENCVLDVSGLGYVLDKRLNLWNSVSQASICFPSKNQISTISQDIDMMILKQKHLIRRSKPLPKEPQYFNTIN